MSYTSNNTDSKKYYQQSFTNYTSRDFDSIKQSLMQHIKSYFPQIYKDFNETSPGMMVLELSAYVGDVLNYYIDDSFKELLLPLSDDRRNIITLSKLSGFKPRPIVPSYVDLSFSLEVDATNNLTENPTPDSTQLLTLDAGAVVASISNPEIVFETLEPIDFSVNKNASEQFTINSLDATTNLASTMIGTRVVKAVSGLTKTITFQIGTPEQFKKLTIPDTDVIEILSCVDTQGNNWYEVEYLAQENVAITGRNASGGSTTNSDGDTTIVPESLEFIRTTKKFISETNEDNTTSLVFGNGIIKNGNAFETTFLQLEQEGVNLPTTNFSPKPLDYESGAYYESLGEAPQSTTLTITYRAGGGPDTVLPADNLTTINSVTTIPAGASTTNLSVTNLEPSVGGKAGDATEEIRYNALANYATQNRVVTKSDYEARTLSIPGKFGSIAKVFCATGGSITDSKSVNELNQLQDLMNAVLSKLQVSSLDDLTNVNLNDPTLTNLLSADGVTITSDDVQYYKNIMQNVVNTYDSNDSTLNPTTDLYVLSYDTEGKLMTSPTLVKNNIRNYLSQYRMLTDKVRILDGFIINFGVFFNVIAFPGMDKSVVKNRCIEKIKELYDVKNMQFKQVLYTADVISVLNNIEGVKAVNDVVFTQKENFIDETAPFTNPLYSKSYNNDGEQIKINELGYGYLYDFSTFFIDNAPNGRGVVLPSFDPSVFEIKNPNTDIKGVVK